MASASIFDELWATRDGEVHEVQERLFLGSVHASTDDKALRGSKISHILVVHPTLETLWPTKYCYRRIPLPDIPVCNLLELLPEALEFIGDALDSRGSRVLVHCTRGISRSSSFVIAFLMLSLSVSFDVALRLVQRKRPVAYPNIGFRAQLYYLESLLAGCKASNFKEKVSWLRTAMPRGDLTLPYSKFRIREAINKPVHQHLEEVCKLSDGLLSNPQLASDVSCWRPLGIFFEILHKYETMPEDSGLPDLVASAAKHLRETIAQFHDSSASLIGLTMARRVAEEMETWVKFARWWAKKQGVTEKAPAVHVEQAALVGGYESDSSSEDTDANAKRQKTSA